MLGSLDRFALRTGVITTVVLAVPLGLAAAWLGGRGEPELALIANLGVLAVFILGSGLAAWVQNRALPIAHGLATAVLAFLVVSLSSLIISLLGNGSWNGLRQLMLMTIAAGCGVLGGVVGSLLRSRGVIPSSDRQRGDGSEHRTR